jgi:hypothetical protein
MTAPVPLDETSKKALARVAVPHMSRYTNDNKMAIEPAFR